jgi:hypothetical protein
VAKMEFVSGFWSASDRFISNGPHCTGEDHRDRGVAQIARAGNSPVSHRVSVPLQDDDARRSPPGRRESSTAPRIRRRSASPSSPASPFCISCRVLMFRILEPEQPEHLLHDRGARLAERARPARPYVFSMVPQPVEMSVICRIWRKIIPGFPTMSGHRGGGCPRAHDEPEKMRMIRPRTLHDQGPFIGPALPAAPKSSTNNRLFILQWVALYVSCLIPGPAERAGGTDRESAPSEKHHQQAPIEP